MAVVLVTGAATGLGLAVHNAGVLNGPDVLAVNTVAPFVLTAIMRKPGG